MILLILLIGLISYLFLQLWAKRQKLPPGPMPLPIIGNILQLGYLSKQEGSLIGALKKLREQYGEIFTIWMGYVPAVHICNLELAQDSMVRKGAHFADRDMPDLFDVPRDGLGIIGTNGYLWSEQRRFALHTFRNFGLGRNIMEQRIMTEVDFRLDIVESEMKDGVWEGNPRSFIEPMVGSVINRMLFNYRFDEKNEKEFFALKEDFEFSLEHITFVDFFTKKWMYYLPLLSIRYKPLIDPLLRLRKFLEKQVDERIQQITDGTHVIDSEPEDYVDAFLAKMKGENEGNTTFTHDELVVNILDLWAAGQETTSTTIQWAFIHLLAHPDVVAEVHKEVAVVAGEGHLSLSHKPKTPKLNAVITEVQRLASIVNMNLWRQCDEDTQVGKYTIPKGTLAAAQLSLIMSNDRFENVTEFDPWRYLKNPDLDQNVIPFGLGKRACLGESLARAELYLILGNMMLNYEILPHGPIPTTDPLNPYGLLNRPQQHEMKLKSIRKRVQAVF